MQRDSDFPISFIVLLRTVLVMFGHFEVHGYHIPVILPVGEGVQNTVEMNGVTCANKVLDHHEFLAVDSFTEYSERESIATPLSVRYISCGSCGEFSAFSAIF